MVSVLLDSGQLVYLLTNRNTQTQRVVVIWHAKKYGWRTAM
jgi:hypothetical protein